MSKIDLDPITSGYNLSKINSNFQKVEDELNNKVLYRNSPAGEPNSMSSNLDMNGQSILNANKVSSNVLEIGGVQVVPTNLAIDPYNGTREALRRSYAEAGLNLVAGSFEVGGTLVNANDVLLHEASGKAYAWGGVLSHVAAPGTDPTAVGSGYVPCMDVLLRSELASSGGAGLIGGVITPITAKSLGGGAVSSQDSTAAVEAAGAIGGTFYVPKGEYIISSAKITKNTAFVFEEGASFKRAPGLDVRQSYWNDGVPMIDAAADGLTITFIDPVFDGNSANQPVVQVGYSGPDATTEPSGWAFRYYPRNAVTAKNCRFVFVRPEFKNGTSGYILVRGDDINRRFKTEIFLDAPIFTDTIYGYGKGDPATPSALGYSPDYVQLLDYVQLFSKDLNMGYLAGATTVGKYAPVGIRATYSGSNPNLGGGTSIFATGKTKLVGMGRKDQNYNGTDYVSNNGIGAIDGYGNAESIYIESVDADKNEAISVRAKGSIKGFTIGSVTLTDCFKGINVSPATGTPCEAVVNIGAITSYGGTIPLVELVGTNNTDKLRYVHIGAYYQYGATTNPASLPANANGLVTLRNIARAVIGSPTIVGGSPTHCMTVTDVDSTTLISPVLKSASLAGVYWDGKGDMRIDNPVGELLGASMISGQNSGVPAKLVVTGGHSDTITDYAILNLNTAGDTLVVGHKTSNVSGQSKGFFAATGASIKLIGNTAGDGVTTPNASPNTAFVYENGNSWNPTIRYGGVGLTTSGTAKVGDIVYNTAPAAGGAVGWVCVTAGSPGVWKTFGTIAA